MEKTVLLHYLLYGSVAIFIIANLIRFIKIATMPVHLRWELYPVPHEPPEKVKHGGSYLEDKDWWKNPLHANKLGELSVMLPEIFLQKGIWEHNRPLWLGTWLFHTACYLIIGMLGLLIIGSILKINGIPVNAGVSGVCSIGKVVYNLTYWVGFISGILGTLGAVRLLEQRLFDKKYKMFTSFGVVFNLLFTGAIFFTLFFGLLKGDVGQLFNFTQNLFTFQPSAGLSSIFTTHIILFALLAIYFPFTHMTHMYTKFFTYHSIRWDDEPLKAGSKREKQIQEALNYPVSWTAPHIAGDGKKTWAEVAMHNPAQEEK